MPPIGSTPSPSRVAAGPGPEVQTWLRMLRVIARIDRLIEQRLQRYGLTRPQLTMLMLLCKAHGPTQKECTEALLVDKANVSGILDRLVRAGLVERRADPADERYNRIYLTPRGRDVAHRAKEAAAEVLEEFFAPVPESDQRTLRAILDRLRLEP